VCAWYPGLPHRAFHARHMSATWAEATLERASYTAHKCLLSVVGRRPRYCSCRDGGTQHRAQIRRSLCLKRARLAHDHQSKKRHGPMASPAAVDGTGGALNSLIGRRRTPAAQRPLRVWGGATTLTAQEQRHLCNGCGNRSSHDYPTPVQMLRRFRRPPTAEAPLPRRMRWLSELRRRRRQRVHPWLGRGCATPRGDETKHSGRNQKSIVASADSNGRQRVRWCPQ